MATLIQSLLRRRTSRAQTTVEVIPTQGGDGGGPDEPEKKDEPEMEEGGEDRPCPECGKSGEECVCEPSAKAGDEDEDKDKDTKPGGGESASATGAHQSRSGDSSMGTNDKSAALTNLPATLADLRAVKSFGADAGFCVECVEKQRTLLEAHEAWSERKTGEAREAGERLAAAARLGNEGTGGAAPVSSNRPAAASARGGKAPLVPGKDPEPVFETYQEYVAHYRGKAGGGLTDLQAHKKATEVCVAQGRGALKIEWFRALQEAEQDHADRVASGAPPAAVV